MKQKIAIPTLRLIFLHLFSHHFSHFFRSGQFVYSIVFETKMRRTAEEKKKKRKSFHKMRRQRNDFRTTSIRVSIEFGAEAIVTKEAQIIKILCEICNGFDRSVRSRTYPSHLDWSNGRSTKIKINKNEDGTTNVLGLVWCWMWKEKTSIKYDRRCHLDSNKHEIWSLQLIDYHFLYSAGPVSCALPIPFHWNWIQCRVVFYLPTYFSISSLFFFFDTSQKENIPFDSVNDKCSNARQMH